jgi:phage/plasmid-associated DNA primase
VVYGQQFATIDLFVLCAIIPLMSQCVLNICITKKNSLKLKGDKKTMKKSKRADIGCSSFDPELVKRIEEMHDEPVFINKSGGISGINRPFFAYLIFKMKVLIYESGEQNFYLYNDENGLWELQTETQIAHLISGIFSDFCRFISRPDAIGKCNGGMIKDVKTKLAGFAEEKDFFKEPKGIFIHCANGVLFYDENQMKWNLEPFSKEFRSRNRTEFIYDPDAKCPQFLNRLIHPAMSLEDADLLQFYLGQCILGYNYSQTFLMMTGTAGGGKSTDVNVFEGIIGLFNCTELRLEHMGSRFELQRLIGKTLLTAKDVKSDFLNSSGASKLKALLGNDVLTTETKLKNTVFQIRGNFNAIVTANNNLRVTLDGDLEAWRRRMLWIKYDNPPPEQVIADFDKILLKTEGSGILNWALEGAVKLLKNGGKIPRTKEQKRRINDLLEESDCVNIFVKKYIKPSPNGDLTSNEILIAFAKYCKTRNWRIIPERFFQENLKSAMLEHYDTNRRNDILRNGKAQRGYAKVQFMTP